MKGGVVVNRLPALCLLSVFLLLCVFSINAECADEVAQRTQKKLINETPIEAKLERLTRIWDRDPHSAFTDLLYWQNRFVCVFRTGKAHVSPDGALQLMSSENGISWQPLSRITSDSADLRDPKLAIGPDGALLVYAAGALHTKQNHTHVNYVWSSLDGKTWQLPRTIGENDSWLWRVIRHETGFYGWGYGTGKSRFIQLFRSDQGIHFQSITPKMLQDKGYPNETAMVMEGDNAWCLLRRDGKDQARMALLGTAAKPFTDWTWRELNVQIGGPSLLRLPGGQFVATVRLYSPKVHTVLCLLDIEKCQLKPLLDLPSSGDSSYAGMVWHQQKLWISYYSSHEGKSSIYVAEVEIKQE